MDLVPLPRSGRPWKSKADFFRPFRTAASEAGENIVPLFDPSIPHDEPHEPDLRDLNFALAALVDVFPDVQPEVFREMLVSVSAESRLQVVTDHLLQRKAKWVQGRFRTTSRRDASAPTNSVSIGFADENGGLEREDLFRSEGYKKAVKSLLYQEFRTLSHSTIKGVLAEQNFSYSGVRPVLQQLASRSWRLSLSSLWTRRAAANSAEGHPYIVWKTSNNLNELATPAVRRTGSPDLDQELYELLVEPIVTKQKQDRLYADFVTAAAINAAEAGEAETLFECECCYTSVPFEELAVCDGDCHYLCLGCIRRTVYEALYGQGWSRTADLHRATVRCFAPASRECAGSIPHDLVRRSLTQARDNHDAWDDFQARITKEILLKSGLPLQRCPSCNYAEVDELPVLRLKHPMAIWAHATGKIFPSVHVALISLFMALYIFMFPLFCIVALAWIVVQTVPSLRAGLRDSLHRVHRSRRGLRFRCQNPACLRTSCTRCSATPWRDPHACFETEQTSLRTAIEASATAAIKRTCPRCMLGFVKASGCNKLVCNCGYTLCYVCRQEITSREGYAHFCQHFRPNGGRCEDCDRCDLYGDEDEEAAIRAAAKETEERWRQKEKGGGEGDSAGGGGARDEAAKQRMIDVLIGESKKQWYEEWLDAIIDAIYA